MFLLFDFLLLALVGGDIDHLLWRDIEVDVVADVIVHYGGGLLLQFVDLALGFCLAYYW